jgi:hypothetical protein
MLVSLNAIFVRLLSMDLTVVLHRTGGVYHKLATHVKDGRRQKPGSDTRMHLIGVKATLDFFKQTINGNSAF